MAHVVKIHVKLSEYWKGKDELLGIAFMRT